MENYQELEVERGHRVLDYFRIHPIVPEPQALIDARAELAECIARAQGLGVDQLVAKRQRNGHVEPRKDELRRKYMMPLKRIGAKKLKFIVGADALSVPHKRKNARTVGEAALRMADAFEPYPAILADAGLESDFLVTMRRKAHDLSLTGQRTGTARNRLSLATNDVAAALARAAELVDVLEGIVMIHHGSDKRLMKYWNRWRRVPGRKGRPPTRRRRKRDDGGDELS